MESALRLLFEHWILTIVLIGAVALLLAAICEEIGKYARHRKDVQLKRELVERGFSADEIAKIIEASAKEPPPPGLLQKFTSCTTTKESSHAHTR